MATTQMNVRIDEDLKVAGDAVLAKLGYSPSQAVRVLWGYVAHFENDPAVIEKLLEEAERVIDPSIDEERQRRINAAEEGLKIVPRCYRDLFADEHPEWKELTDDEVMLRVHEEFEKQGYVPLHNRFDSNGDLREYIAVERARERGWLEFDESSEGESRDYREIWYEVAERVKNGQENPM